MTRHLTILIACLLSLLAGGLIAQGAAPAPALPSAAYMPIVLRDGLATQPTPLQTEPAILVAKDSGLASLVVLRDTRTGAVPGALRTFVATATRPDYRLRVAELVGSELENIAGAPEVAVAPADGDPGLAWSPEGPKQGAVSMVALPGGLRLVYTSREVGNPTGPFYLWTVDIGIAGVAPLGP